MKEIIYNLEFNGARSCNSTYVNDDATIGEIKKHILKTIDDEIKVSFWKQNNENVFTINITSGVIEEEK